jgi:hypothetical protein
MGRRTNYYLVRSKLANCDREGFGILTGREFQYVIDHVHLLPKAASSM